MAMTNELAVAYRATTYRVFLPPGICALRVNQPAETLRGWLEMAGASQFAILTAHNPGSQRLDAAHNLMRQQALQQDVLRRGYLMFPAENVSDGAGWPVEESCCVIGMALAEADQLAYQYGQNALVFGGKDGIPHLHWIEKTK